MSPTKCAGGQPTPGVRCAPGEFSVIVIALAFLTASIAVGDAIAGYLGDGRLGEVIRQGFRLSDHRVDEGIECRDLWLRDRDERRRRNRQIGERD